ncbi:hypothetical protein ACWEOZ_30635 [Actinoplanes sp. NPDC004185]
MTVARGSRPIEVGGTAYRWTVRRRAAYHRGDSWTLLPFVVEQATGHGALLMVTLPDRSAPAGPPVSPSAVAESIDRALTAGWRPDWRGPAFRSRPKTSRWGDEFRGGRPVHRVRHAGPRRDT